MQQLTALNPPRPDCFILQELARDVAAKNLPPADVTEEVLFQASNDDRSLAASAAAKGLAAATDVALQQLMSPEDRVRE